MNAITIITTHGNEIGVTFSGIVLLFVVAFLLAPTPRRNIKHIHQKTQDEETRSS